MMNSLLQRQIRKHLGEDFLKNEDAQKFIEAINRSYENYEDQFQMLQRAMSISSEELFEVNKELKEKAASQKQVIDKLNNVIQTLKVYDLPQSEDSLEIGSDSYSLVELIDKQTKEILAIDKQREELLSELSHQNQELSDYAHMVSHDLKSPLRSIDALASWLHSDYKDTLDKAGVSHLNLIRENVEKMDVLIKGILEYSKIGKTKSENYDVNLQFLVTSILSSIHIPKHIDVVVLSELPTLKGDKFRLQQLFQNLIENAIKYNDKEIGHVEINVTDSGEHWHFTVKDNGTGIKEEYFEKIFSVFQKLENNLNSSGIGLSIVKKIVELYNGSIWVESIIGKGATFHFKLPK